MILDDTFSMRALAENADVSVVTAYSLFGSRQKIVAAIQTGVVPDMFTNNPGEIIALYAWDDKLLDVSDVVETQKSQYSETALRTAYCYNRVTKKRSFYGAPYTLAARPNHSSVGSPERFSNRKTANPGGGPTLLWEQEPVTIVNKRAVR